MNTSKTYLFYKATTEATAYEKLCDITSYPDVWAAPSRLDKTTLSDTQHVYEKDIADVPEMQFGCNYAKADMTKIKALEGQQLPYQLQFGESGADGMFNWTGDIFFTPTGGSVGAVRAGQITCYPSTQITVATA